MRRSGVPELPGILTATEVLATAEHIAGLQEPCGAIGWPDGHTDAWDHVECAMALSVCGLSGPARRAYDWLRDDPARRRVVAQADRGRGW